MRPGPTGTSPGSSDKHGVDHLGLAAWGGEAAVMATAHAHDEVEINVGVGGSLSYLSGGRLLSVPPDRMVAFWGVVPHQLVGGDPGTELLWVTVPTATVLSWGLPAGLVAQLLRGGFVVDPSAADDARNLRRWRADLAEPRSADGVRFVQLEVQARLLRLGHAVAACPARPTTGEGRAQLSLAQQHAAVMAGYVAEHFRSPLRVADVAAAVPLHPHHAMTVFRDVIGVTIGWYVAQCRLAEAQRLLVVTDRGLADIAAEVGFGSVSRFHAVFREHTGTSPAAFRRALRAG